MTQNDIYIKMSPEKRLEVATGLFDFVFEYLMVNFKKRYPDYSQKKILELVKARVLHGREKSIPKDD